MTDRFFDWLMDPDTSLISGFLALEGLAFLGAILMFVMAAIVLCGGRLLIGIIVGLFG